MSTKLAIYVIFIPPLVFVPPPSGCLYPDNFEGGGEGSQQQGCGQVPNQFFFGGGGNGNKEG